MKTSDLRRTYKLSSEVDIFRREYVSPGKRPQIHKALEQLPLLLCIRVEGIQGYRLSSCVKKVLGWSNEDAKSESFLDQLFEGEATRSEAKSFFQSSNPDWRNFACRTKSGKIIEICWRTVYFGDGIYMALGVEFGNPNPRENSLEAEKNHALDMNQAKSELIANVSHEILNPLNSIMGFAEILENEVGDSFFRGCASTIRENGRFLLEIITDLMDITQIENGQLPLLLEVVDPWEVVTAVKDLMEILARDKNLPLIIERNENAPDNIMTDPKRLRQLLVNLVGNGIKFTEAGSITIRLGPITSRDPQQFEIEIIDTGIGINPNEIDTLFEAFVRGSNHNSAGAGLGLSICRKLSRHLQGRLILRSEIGQGSTFVLRLPVLCKDTAEKDCRKG